jgi:rare lipoprotein A
MRGRGKAAIPTLRANYRRREVGLPERKLFVKVGPTGFKRTALVMMLVAAPLVSAEPISSLQEAQPFLSPPAPVIENTASPKIKVRTAARSFHGTASWYSETDPFINLRTANGEIFDDTRMTCASWDYPFGTRLRVTNLQNGKSVIVRVNDRGPAKRLRRIVDLTRSAFRRIADTKTGIIKVRVSRLVD